jgi:4-hydroxy-3-polyprenylbenzoate decarboxylase
VAFADLRELIADLDKRGQLRCVTAPVSRDLEIAEITDRVSKSPGGGPALFFERVKGSEMPVVINLLHTSTIGTMEIPRPKHA